MSPPPALPAAVLAAVDFLPASALVVEHALAMARHLRAVELHFLHVRARPGDEAEQQARRAELEGWLDARVRRAGGVPHTVKVIAHEASGDPSDVIVEMAGDLLASAVIVGTHGRRGFRRRLIGSVAESVVRAAGCPVLVVRPQMHDAPMPRFDLRSPGCIEVPAPAGEEPSRREPQDDRRDRRHGDDTRPETRLEQRLSV